MRLEVSNERRKTPKEKSALLQYKAVRWEESQDYMNRLGATRKVQDYLNSAMTDTPQVKTVFEIAQETGLYEETVRRVLMENGHGYNGITF